MNRFLVVTLGVVLIGCSSESELNRSGPQDGGAILDGVGATDSPLNDGPSRDTLGVDARGNCEDPCPSPNAGVSWGCQKRFMLGANYAWHHFGGDFGGVVAWDVKGVASDRSTYLEELRDMRAHGATAVRWWMYPSFHGDGVTFDEREVALGLSATGESDLLAALELADQADVYLMLCLFSFDNFKPGSRAMANALRDPSKRDAMLNHVVRPIARIVQGSKYRHRMLAWDVINEPEWAMTGPSPYGDPDYDPDTTLEPVTHAEMEDFVEDAIAVLRSESSALVTVGATAWKWAHAWTGVDIDLHQFHMYDWIDSSYPYTALPSNYLTDGKPIVMGEFFFSGVAGDDYSQVVSTWWENGFAGALGWDYGAVTDEELDKMKEFAGKHACETRYTTTLAEL